MYGYALFETMPEQFIARGKRVRVDTLECKRIHRGQNLQINIIYSNNNINKCYKCQMRILCIHV